jgi:hypothetical protein
VQRRIDVPDSARSSLRHSEDLRIIASAPRSQDSDNLIHKGAIVGLDETHACAGISQHRQSRHRAVPDLTCDLRDSARFGVPVNVDQFDSRDVRAGCQNVEDEAEADRRQLIWIANQ